MPDNLDKSSCKVFFYVTSCEYTAAREKGAWFQDLIVNLADGLNSLGVRHYSSNNYWQISPDQDLTLLQSQEGVTHHDCDIVVLERQWFEENRSLPKDLFHPNRKYLTVYLDCLDGIRTYSWRDEFREFDFIFKTHYVKNFKYPSNVYPWAFGLSSRVLRELENSKEIKDRNKSILLSFRHTKKAHSLRKYIENNFAPKVEDFLPIDSTLDDVSVPPQDPYHYLRWVQTGRRHYPSYYGRLKQSSACAVFGGFFIGPKVFDDNPRLMYSCSRILAEAGIKTNRIVQWDSWRLWESLAAGCATFHVDFQKYGFVLPVMPENWKHYIGIDLDRIESNLAKIKQDPSILESISNEGRNWAIQNYSPHATANRFLETVIGK